MLKAYADPEVRQKLHEEAIEFKSGPAIGICSTWWDYMVLQTAVLPKNKQYEGKTLGQIAKAQGKGIIDAFLDLAVEENLDSEWLHGENNVDEAAVAKILTYPNAIIGLSRRRRACPVPERLRLLDPAAVGMGAREAGDDPGAGGAAADLRTRPRPSGSTTAACCGPAWSPTS